MVLRNYKHIKSQLNRFIKKYFLNELIRGIILFVVFSLLYAFMSAMVEYFLWLPENGRKYLFFAMMLIISLFFAVFIFVPLLNYIGLRKPLSEEKSAAIIGKHFPEVEDKLLNTLQLKKQNIDSELLPASIEQKSSELKIFRFSEAVDLKKNIKFIPLLFIPLLIFVGLKITHLDREISDSYQRIISYNQEFIPKIPFQISIKKNSKVIEGQSCYVKVKISGNEIPAQIYLLQNKNQLLFQKETDTSFSYYFPAIHQNTEFLLKADKYTFGPYQIQLIKPPLIEKFKVDLLYPNHTHLKPRHFEHTGNFSVPEGTKIRWRINSVHTDKIRFKIKDSVYLLSVQNQQTEFSKYAYKDFRYKITPQNKDLKDFESLSYGIEVIKDQYPQLKVIEKQDSINRQNIYHILASDDYGLHRLKLIYRVSESHQSQSVDIPFKKSDLIQITSFFPGTLKLEEGKSYEYYFQVFDNDAVHRYKSVKSKTYYFNKFTKNQLEEKNLQQQQSNLENLSRLNKDFNKQQKDLEKFKNNLTQKQSLDWNTKKQLKQSVKQAEKREEFFQQAIEKYKNILDKSLKKNETQEELKKRLDELAKMEKKKKLLDELKKLAEKLDKEDLLKKLDKLEKYAEHQEKSLERILELTKKYYMQQKLQKMSEKLDVLSKKQEQLAKQDTDKKQQQDSLNAEIKKMQQQADSLQKMNKQLKVPMKMPEMKPDMEDIKQDMKSASEELEQQDSKAANTKQQKAANKMKKLSKQMQMMMGGGGEQNEEDINTLQAILKSLLNFSFDEEKLMTDLYTKQGKTYLSKQLLAQNNLKKYFSHINDSLYTLALRNPKVSQKILDQAYEIDFSLNETLSSLSENQHFKANQHAQYVLSGANILANMLSITLDNMKNSTPSAGKGKGKKKGKSISLPDIIKKQGEQVKKMQQGIKKMKQGKTKKESMSAAQYELYKQQQRIKDELQQLGDKFSDKATQQKIKDIGKQMDDLQKRILKEGMTRSNLNKMIQLQHELLKLKNAAFTQHEDNKRQARTNYKSFQTPDSLQLRLKKQYFPQDEILKRKQIPVNQQIKKKIKLYLKQINDD